MAHNKKIASAVCFGLMFVLIGIVNYVAKDLGSTRHARDMNGLAANETAKRTAIYDNIFEEAIKKITPVDGFPSGLSSSDREVDELDNLDGSLLDRLSGRGDVYIGSVKYIHHFHNHHKHESDGNGAEASFEDGTSESEIVSTTVITTEAVGPSQTDNTVIVTDSKKVLTAPSTETKLRQSPLVITSSITESSVVFVNIAVSKQNMTDGRDTKVDDTDTTTHPVTGSESEVPNVTDRFDPRQSESVQPTRGNDSAAETKRGGLARNVPVVPETEDENGGHEIKSFNDTVAPIHPKAEVSVPSETRNENVVSLVDRPTVSVRDSVSKPVAIDSGPIHHNVTPLTLVEPSVSNTTRNASGSTTEQNPNSSERTTALTADETSTSTNLAPDTAAKHEGATGTGGSGGEDPGDKSINSGTGLNASVTDGLLNGPQNKSAVVDIVAVTSNGSANVKNGTSTPTSFWIVPNGKPQKEGHEKENGRTTTGVSGSRIRKRSIHRERDGIAVDRSMVVSIVAPVRFRSLPCVSESGCGSHGILRAVHLIPRNGLSTLCAQIRCLKTQQTYEPAGRSHALTEEAAFPIEGVFAADANAFAVKQVDTDSRLFLFYGGREPVDRFDSLPDHGVVKTTTNEPYRPDLFTVAVYVPRFSSEVLNDTATTVLPLATKHSRMLFVSSGTASDITGRNDGSKIVGAIQMWFRDIGDVRAEFSKLQQLLCLNRFVAHARVQIIIAFTLELPADEVSENPPDVVDRIWKDALSDNGLYRQISVEMYMNRTHGFYRNADFESVTVHGFLLDGRTLTRIIGEELEVLIETPSSRGTSDESCDVRMESLVKA